MKYSGDRSSSCSAWIAAMWIGLLTLAVVGCDGTPGVGDGQDGGGGPDAADAADAAPGSDAADADGLSDAGDGAVGSDAAVVPSSCDPQVLGSSNMGCVFWAVDLDNEFATGAVAGTAAAEQLAVLIANPQPSAVTLSVYQNTAAFGSTVAEQLVTTATAPAGAQVRIDLPQREVDGSMGQNGGFVGNSGSGTFVSSHGYRIVADAPVAAYQMNPVVAAFSNDAALLLPEHVLGTDYTVVGWPTANPCGNDMMPMESLPDHTSITIVGVTANTVVTVDVTHAVMASGGDSGSVISETPVGGQIVATLGPYDVLNLESLQPTLDAMACLSLVGQDGDFSGSRVTASAPVAVFSSAERGSAVGGAEPPAPAGGDSCCTDHLEEQLLPDRALGWQFVVGRSPVRSGQAGSLEPDIYRLVATTNNTVVTTTLAAPFDQLNLQAGEAAVFWSSAGFTVDVQGGAVALGQYLVSHGWVPQSNLGDPAWVTIGAVGQMRNEQILAIPQTYTDNYLVITYATGTALQLDGVALGPTTVGCDHAAVGALGGTTFEQLTCSVSAQQHTVSADHPIHVTVFGYGELSSFAYSAGTGVAPINP